MFICLSVCSSVCHQNPSNNIKSIFYHPHHYPHHHHHPCHHHHHHHHHHHRHHHHHHHHQVIDKKLAMDTRVTILGHIQRGGAPSAFDVINCYYFYHLLLLISYPTRWSAIKAFNNDIWYSSLLLVSLYNPTRWSAFSLWPDPWLKNGSGSCARFDRGNFNFNFFIHGVVWLAITFLLRQRQVQKRAWFRWSGRTRCACLWWRALPRPRRWPRPWRRRTGSWQSSWEGGISI